MVCSREDWTVHRHTHSPVYLLYIWRIKYNIHYSQIPKSNCKVFSDFIHTDVKHTNKLRLSEILPPPS